MEEVKESLAAKLMGTDIQDVKKYKVVLMPDCTITSTFPAYNPRQYPELFPSCHSLLDSLPLLSTMSSI
jgi:hypothetical protein